MPRAAVPCLWKKSEGSCPSGLPCPLFAKSESDLSEIVAHVAQDDEEAGSGFGEALLDHGDLLGGFPRMGNASSKRPQVRIRSGFLTAVFTGVFRCTLG